MKFTIDVDMEELVDAIAAKIGTPAAEPVEEPVVEEDDSLTDDEPEVTREAMNEKVGGFVRAVGKDKVLAAIGKVVKGATKIKDIPKEKYQAVLDALAKVKK